MLRRAALLVKLIDTESSDIAGSGSDMNDLRLVWGIPLEPRLDSAAQWDLFASWLVPHHVPPRKRYRRKLKVPTYDSDGHPTRILDLSQEDQMVLHENSSKPYVALSHRWGTSQHLSATTRTLEQLKSGIALDLLPATFKDAVFAARRLGVYSL
jgi:hypothetical protein